MPNKIRVLLADDHRMFVEGLKFILGKEVYIEIKDCVYAGKDAIEKCHQGEIDVVLMDVNMPLMDGIYACTEIKRYNPAIKILFVTMITDLTTVTNAVKAGADAYILKGNGSDDILAAFKTISKNEIFISEQLRHFFSFDNPNQIKTRAEYITFSQNIISQREKEVLKQIVDGLTNEQIAGVLSISVRTVDTHRSNMLTKLKLPNTAALVRFALENKLVQ